MTLKIIAVSTFALSLTGAGLYYYWAPDMVHKRTIQKTLDRLEAATATQDRTAINNTLSEVLSDTSRIELSVAFFKLPGQNIPPIVQEFDKQTFLTFIDNITYSLRTYSFKGQLQDYKPIENSEKVRFTFTSQQTAEGISYFAGTHMNVRFTAETGCTAEAHFDQQKVLLDNMECNMQLNSAPAPKPEAQQP